VNTHEILGSAERRIRECRTAEAELRLRDETGRPLAGARVHVELVRHAFKFGANAFRLLAEPDPARQRGYEERYAALLNYATLPFYWGAYERAPEQTGEQRLGRMAAWCAQNGIAAKGHPLVWHEVFPEWGAACTDREIVERLERRVRSIVSGFRDRIRIWDVVNEATVAGRFENAVGRWMGAQGPAACVDAALRWAREADPSATLLYNDFNVSDDLQTLVRVLLDRRSPLDAIGIQSHMHKGVWPVERVWEVCESYAAFGLPLHWTEATVVSGRLKAPEDNDWHAVRRDWPSTAEGEASQAAYGEAFYTVLFSHPAVEAVTWWDFSDSGAWQGAPAGLVRADMTPKPLYERLARLVGKSWATDIQTRADESGCARARCFFGEHRLDVTDASGAPRTGAFVWRRHGARTVDVLCARCAAGGRR
jgi:GH35 family endo-1,4-beta-xylanase